MLVTQWLNEHRRRVMGTQTRLRGELIGGGYADEPARFKTLGIVGRPFLLCSAIEAVISRFEPGE